MRLDLEGQILMAGKPITAVSQKLQTCSVIQTPASSPIHNVPQSFPTRWQVKVARLRQRVQEVRMLILEDIQDLQEPLDALSNERGILSSQETMQLEKATAAYEQTIQECGLALANILEPFMEAQERSEAASN